jgi:exonuclease I
MSSSSNEPTAAAMLQAEVAEQVERAKLTPDAVRAANEDRLAARRKELLAEAGLTEETLSTAVEEVRAKFSSRFTYEVLRSPEAQLYHEFMKAAIEREKKLKIEAEAEGPV